MPDTNALLNAMDLFEQTSAFYDVIILQIVLEELRNRSLPLYNRLIGLTKSEEKRFYVFFNEFRLETHVLREIGESINDRNDRAIRHAARWYSQHLQQAVRENGRNKTCPTVVVLSDDKDSLRKSDVEGISGSSLAAYVSQLDDADRLLDIVSTGRSGADFKAKNVENIYPEYYSVSKINTGIKAGTLHQGIFNVSTYNYLEGSVHVPAFEKSLIILGRDNSNRAVSGDVVVIELLPQSQWKSPSIKVVDEEAVNRDENADAEDGETVFTERERRALQDEVKKIHGRTSEGRPQPTAKIVGIIKRNWRQYVGHIDGGSTDAARQGRKQQTVFLVPMDRRIPRIRIRTRQVGELLGKRVLVTIDSWDRDSRYPVGHFVRSLGELESKGAETEALLLEYDVQYRPFPQAVLDCLPPQGHDWRVPAGKDDPGWRDRQDLRDLLVCSIDPPGCQDIDDALHARSLPNGNVEVGVHIADVSHFVKPNTAMDTEAAMRGTTVYLVDKRIDMLPMLLGTDLCSLKPYVERYAFSVIWELNPSDASIINVNFTKSVIQSKEAFSYEAAQLRIDDPAQTDPLTTSMRNLLSLSCTLRANRMAAGALNLASPEVRIQANTDSETSDPADVQTKQHLPTMSLVEEFMLLANISVARKIHTSFPATSLLRRHVAPPKTNFDELSTQLKVKKGFELDVSSSKALAGSLDRCTDSQNPFFNTLVRILATRCMMSAEYFPSFAVAEPEFRHYGLASDIYTHFTSPIRRYADLVVHRQLAAAIEYEGVHPSLNSKGKLEAVCKNINIRHRNAQLAGRASVEYYVSQALKGRVVVEEGHVMRVFSNGVVVFVAALGIEGVVRLKGILGEGGDEKESKEPEGEFDAEEYVLRVKGPKGKEVAVALFDKVRVRIRDELEQSSGKRKLRMELVW